MAVAAEDLKGGGLDVETDLEAENTRLQARVEETEAEREWKGERHVRAMQIIFTLRDLRDQMQRERDGHKAQSEQRGEALEASGWEWPAGEWHQPRCTRRGSWEWLQKKYGYDHGRDNDTECSKACALARAAINISPEEEKEKSK